MDEFEFTNTDNIAQDLMDIKETARIKKMISQLYMYDNDVQQLTNIYTNILLEDNVCFILTKISQDKIFLKHFPEFYEKNEFGENVINCQQNSEYHKYGVFKHILHTIETVGTSQQIPLGDWQLKLLKWTMLFHDIGKPYVKKINEDGTDSFAGHDDKSVELAAGILDRFYFTEEEKKIILTLIKYHDRFLNEGEITYDNMKFLASELNNNKELFYMLLEVKDADARAKNVDVYNKYKLVKAKYLEFINTFFTYNKSDNIGEEQKNETNTENIQSITSTVQSDEISVVEMDRIIENIILRKDIISMYQPIIDISKKNVCGYEVTTKIKSSKKINMLELFHHARDMELYDKVQQVLLIDRMEKFESISNKESNCIFIISDLNSYSKYINKPRLYDNMAKQKIVIKFINYEKKDVAFIQETIETIHKNRGSVALNNFGIGSLKIEDLNILKPDFIIPDESLIKDIENDIEKQRFLSDLITYSISSNTKIVVGGIDTKEKLYVVKKLGAKYVQGSYFAVPEEGISIIKPKIEQLLANVETEEIL